MMAYSGSMPLTVLKIRDGLWRWTVPHPAWTPGKEWPPDVGSVYLETPEAIVLVDPIVPADGTDDREKFWKALDGDVERWRLPVVVVVSNRYHGRSADAVRERYASGAGVGVLVPRGAEAEISCRATSTFRPGETLPGGVVTIPVEGYDPAEAVLWLPGEGGCLVAADALIGDGAGGIRVPPESWAVEVPGGKEHYAERFRPSLRRLLDRPFSTVLLSHGDPVVAGARRVLETALLAP